MEMKGEEIKSKVLHTQRLVWNEDEHERKAPPRWNSFVSVLFTG